MHLSLWYLFLLFAAVVLFIPYTYYLKKNNQPLENQSLNFSKMYCIFRYEMRLSKNQIDHMAFYITRNLIKDNKIISENKNNLMEDFVNLITEEFQKEDKLDQEVRVILNQHMEKIRNENIEYQTMFRMIKTKLAKEKDIIL